MFRNRFGGLEANLIGLVDLINRDVDETRSFASPRNHHEHSPNNGSRNSGSDGRRTLSRREWRSIKRISATGHHGRRCFLLGNASLNGGSQLNSLERLSDLDTLVQLRTITSEKARKQIVKQMVVFQKYLKENKLEEAWVSLGRVLIPQIGFPTLRSSKNPQTPHPRHLPQRNRRHPHPRLEIAVRLTHRLSGSRTIPTTAVLDRSRDEDGSG